MILDAELTFDENATLTAAYTSKSIDLGQTNPDMGMYPQFAAVVRPRTDFAGTGTITVTIEDSADNSSFAAVAATGAIVANTITKPIALRMPVSHRRYVRVKTTVSGSITAGTGVVAITDNFDVPAGYYRDTVEFFEPDPNASKVNLESQVQGVLPVVNGGTGKDDGSNLGGVGG